MTARPTLTPNSSGWRAAFADAFDFRGMESIKRVLVLGWLCVETFGAFQERVQWVPRGRVFGARGRLLVPGLAQDDTGARALPFDGAFETLELFGAGVTAGLAAQCPAFLGIGLFQDDAGSLGRLYDLGPGDRQPAAIRRMRDGFLLHGDVDDDSLELGRADGLGDYRRVDRGFGQGFDAGFSYCGAKASDLGGIARELRRVVLPYDVF
jgi:hypothetical protein